MATYFTQEPTIGLVRFIVRVPNNLLPNGPAPSDIRGNTGAIEASDIFGMADGYDELEALLESASHRLELHGCDGQRRGCVDGA